MLLMMMMFLCPITMLLTSLGCWQMTTLLLLRNPLVLKNPLATMCLPTPLNHLLKVTTHVSPQARNVLHLWCICLMKWNVLTMHFNPSWNGHINVLKLALILIQNSKHAWEIWIGCMMHYTMLNRCCHTWSPSNFLILLLMWRPWMWSAMTLCLSYSPFCKTKKWCLLTTWCWTPTTLLQGTSHMIAS